MFHTKQAGHQVKLFVPDLPKAGDILPWLERIDGARQYTNNGPLIRELESLLARDWPLSSSRIERDIQVVTLSSGTTALELAIPLQKLAPGAEVLLPVLTFPATASTVLRNGLVPLFTDVDPDSWLLTPAIARAVAVRRPIAMVMPVAAFGLPVDVDAWDKFTADTGIPVLIDAAAAFGNQAVGRDVSLCFSMHATKPFGIGEGGLFVTRDADMAHRLRRQANFGFENYKIIESGTNGKLSEYAAAVALAQWQRWPSVQAHRQQLWMHYRCRLSELSGIAMQDGWASATSGTGLVLPATLVLHLPIPAAEAGRKLAALGIESRRWYHPLLQSHPAFSSCPVLGPDGGSVLPVAASIGEYCLGLPWHTSLSELDIDHICKSLQSCLDL